MCTGPNYPLAYACGLRPQPSSREETMTSPLSRRRETPFELSGIARLNRMLDEALGGWMGGLPRGGALTSDWLPPCDITEDDRSIRLQLELPGVKPEDIHLSIEDNVLSVRGEKRQV